MAYTLSSLPSEVREKLLQSHIIANSREYITAKHAAEDLSSADDLFSGMGITVKPVDAVHAVVGVLWGTDNYATEAHHSIWDSIPNDPAVLALIVPRSQKAKDIQKLRTKDKAEVFTPSWVCNLQNNLVDDAILGEGRFNIQDPEDRTKWLPTSSPVTFPEGDYTWISYVAERRLEMACGEAPYLVSPYDTVDGSVIPVRRDGLWWRIGLLDRKLRVISENVNDKGLWKHVAFRAIQNIYGNEFQGDNLLLARLNVLNTYRDYLLEVWSEEPTDEEVLELAEIVSWNIFQSDGLKQVVPNSCTATCVACQQRIRVGHDGQVNLLKWGNEVKSMEEFFPLSSFSPAR